VINPEDLLLLLIYLLNHQQQLSAVSMFYI